MCICGFIGNTQRAGSQARQCIQVTIAWFVFWQLTCRGTSMSCSTWNGSQKSFCVSLLCRLITPPVPLANLAAEDRRRDLVYSTSVRPDCKQQQTWWGLVAVSDSDKGARLQPLLKEARFCRWHKSGVPCAREALSSSSVSSNDSCQPEVAQKHDQMSGVEGSACCRRALKLLVRHATSLQATALLPLSAHVWQARGQSRHAHTQQGCCTAGRRLAP